MSSRYPSTADQVAWLRDLRQVRGGWLVIIAVLLVLALFGLAISGRTAGAPAQAANHDVSGAGKSIIEGGTGGAAPLPVTTLLAFHANAQGGDFECLALAPAGPKGPGSGEFTVNVMYVTGTVNSMEVAGNSATLQGTATVTGLGAGHNLPFTAQVTAGGPGTTVVLTVSGMTFHETLIEGAIHVG